MDVRQEARWLRRLGIAVLAIVALVIALRILWGAMADHRLNAEINSLVARGEPIHPSDVTFPSIPDQNNAAWYYTRAIAAIGDPKAINDQWEGWDESYTPQQIANLGQLVNNEQAALKLARQARPYATAVWPDPGYAAMTPPNFLFPDLNGARALADLLAAAAFAQHNQGQDAQAIERIRDIHHEADALEQYYPSLVAHLVAIGIDALAAESATEISRDLRVENASDGQDGSPASAKQIADLINELSQEQAYQSSGRRCWFTERRMALEAPAALVGVNVSSLAFAVVRPAFTASSVEALKNDDAADLAVSQPNWPAAQAVMTASAAARGFPLAPKILGSILTASFDRAVQVHFCGLCDRRAAVVALAISLYRADESGLWPQSAGELVPKYLAAIPVDPFAANGALLQYKTAAAGPIIYSVGVNGVDDGGSDQPMLQNSRRIRGDFSRWERLDAVYHLTAPVAATRPGSGS